MTDNIFLFVPNIIDYCRVIFAFMSFYYMPTDHYKAACLYLLSGFLDEFDGRLARLLKQTSKLGALLDQLTDRIITMCMCAVLCHFYPTYILFFQFSMALDIFSHWVYLHSSLMIGKENHKHVDLSENFIVRHYYTNEHVLSVMCLGNEIFYCLLYLRHFTIGPVLGNLSIGLWTLLLFVAAPITIAKMVISGVQMVIACRNIAAIDITEREKEAREERNKYKGE
ncbi:CDP-diacylglycerol--inositol 3-phosphatidyltransferase-like [Patella vulgata]|uniref:CDP-diacylglycerol--inositol 3-phosphatidyltransferase-like n=1 Tax=Patella vulgata TaxID=6465 RepID=UPI0024A83F72|nr:CDP-diacylglycerol--inositol 3-phosphatidyltransferase-like [Patella vulgata]